MSSTEGWLLLASFTIIIPLRRPPQGRVMAFQTALLDPAMVGELLAFYRWGRGQGAQAGVRPHGWAEVGSRVSTLYSGRVQPLCTSLS